MSHSSSAPSLNGFYISLSIDPSLALLYYFQLCIIISFSPTLALTVSVGYFNFTDKLLEVEHDVFEALSRNPTFSAVRIEGLRPAEYFASIGDVRKVNVLNRLFKASREESLNLAAWNAAIKVQCRYRFLKAKRLQQERVQEKLAQEEAERMRLEKIKRDALEYRVASYLQSLVRSMLARRLIARMQKELYF